MSSTLNVVTRKTSLATVIELHGDISSDGDAAIKSAYRTAVSEGASAVLFNMSNAAYINTSGISVLIAVVMEAKKAGHKILVSGVSPHYKKVFDLVRFSVYVTMFETEEAALESLKTS
ncbi:MAG: STAS domain-containing protein [bacterium]|nr:STAS domain-containing protein [bacterium]